MVCGYERIGAQLQPGQVTITPFTGTRQMSRRQYETFVVTGSGRLEPVASAIRALHDSLFQSLVSPNAFEFQLTCTRSGLLPVGSGSTGHRLKSSISAGRSLRGSYLAWELQEGSECCRNDR